MMEARLNICIPNHWLEHVHSATVKLVGCKPIGKAGAHALLEIEAGKKSTDDFLRAMQCHPDVCRVKLSELSENSALASVVINKCAACSALNASECFLTSAVSKGDGHVEWRVVFEKSDELATLVKRLREMGCTVELRGLASPIGNPLLTKRQEEVIRAALIKGYYDVPKRITIKELARMFSVSPSTLNEILLRAEKKIIRYYLEKRVNTILISDMVHTNRG